MLVVGWIMIIGIVFWAVQIWSDRATNPNRALVAGPAGEVVLKRNRAGHFVADGEINGRRVTFLLDTGATQIAIPAPLARELGLSLGPPVTLQTAAGPATGYPTRLASVRLAGFEGRDLGAVVAEGMDAGLVLLGMNFLRRLDLVQRGDELVLHARKPVPAR